MDLTYGILNAVSPENLLYAFIGCLLGTMVGVLPGLGPVSAVAILFPFTSYLPPTGMVICLAAIYYGAMYGGSTTAILINVPGETAAIVTAIDGFEMTKQGRPGPALAISAIGSFMAGIVGSILIAFIGPSIARVALTFGPAEYLGLGLFSINCIAAMSGRSIIKGLAMAVLGMILVAVGVDVASSVPRLTFGSYQLYQGFDVIPLLIGLFGMGEVLRTAEETVGPAVRYKLGRLMPNREEMRLGLIASARATGVCFPLGLFPGMVPAVAAFVAYSLERQVSSHPERFGKGAIEGVAASEAANNAAAMGNFVPLLSLGVPAGPTTALLLAALTMYGIIPGPMLFVQRPQFVWTVIGSFFVANCILVILNLPLVGLWARIATVPPTIMAAAILTICLVGSFVIRSNMFDVWVSVITGVLGWMMRKGAWPLAPMVLGFVLGPMIENNARRVISIGPGLLLQRPIFWMFIVMAIVAFWASRRFLVAQEEER